MKVKSNLKSGSIIDDTRQSASNLSGQAGDFLYAAQQQAESAGSAISNAANSLKLGVTDLIGIS